MAGMNSTYRILLPTVLKEQLKKEAEKEGLLLSELVRKKLKENLEFVKIRIQLEDLNKKVDRILEKI